MLKLFDCFSSCWQNFSFAFYKTNEEPQDINFKLKNSFLAPQH